MKLNKLLKVFVMFLAILFVSGCNDKIKVKNIVPSIEQFQTYEITSYMGNNVNYSLDESIINSIKEDMVYFYECKYYTADTTRTPLVQLTITADGNKLDFICALDSNENRCYMLHINEVSYNVKVNKEFKEEHNFFARLYQLAGEYYYSK